MSDLRSGWRAIGSSPGFAAVVIATLALAIGANTAVFSVIDGVLLRPLPYPEPERLVMVLDRSARDPNVSKLFGSYADYREFSVHASSFESFAAATWAVGGSILTGRGPAKPVM